MRVFKDVGLVEQLGSGMERILSAYNKSIFEFSQNFMKVTFRFPEKNDDNNKKQTIKSDDKKATIKSDDKKATIKTDDKKQKIIRYLEENGAGKNKDFAELLGLKSTRIKELLYQLMDENMIAAQGSRRKPLLPFLAFLCLFPFQPCFVVLIIRRLFREILSNLFLDAQNAV